MDNTYFNYLNNFDMDNLDDKSKDIFNYYKKIMFDVDTLLDSYNKNKCINEEIIISLSKNRNTMCNKIAIEKLIKEKVFGIKDDKNLDSYDGAIVWYDNDIYIMACNARANHYNILIYNCDENCKNFKLIYSSCLIRRNTQRDYIFCNFNNKEDLLNFILRPSISSNFNYKNEIIISEHLTEIKINEHKVIYIMKEKNTLTTDEMITYTYNNIFE